MKADRPRNVVGDWRSQAKELGVNPDEPDDHRYWHELDNKRHTIETFRYHQPSEEQIARIAEVRRAHIECAKVIMRSTPVSDDQTASLRKLHESMMTANKAIVCDVNA